MSQIELFKLDPPAGEPLVGSFDGLCARCGEPSTKHSVHSPHGSGTCAGWVPPAKNPSRLEVSAAPTKPEPERGAEMSMDLKYRYKLWRRWGEGPWVLWVMLNPSLADSQREDPTLHRCMNFARAWGFGGIYVGNLAALVSPDPDALYDKPDPIGANCDKLLLEMAEETVRGGGRMVVAWGVSIRFDSFAPAVLRGRDKAVLTMLAALGDVYCLGKTASGAPKHPHARGRSRVPEDAHAELYLAKTAV